MINAEVKFEAVFDKNYDHLDQIKTAGDYINYIIENIALDSRLPRFVQA